ncbi:hypothetical protein BX600DRAFT_517868 [Xylariales sp. PMI_506]|nr:hypothetical protein BX600DRAFT_517868 [Xylariales sp. PMI_506]
MSLLKLPPELLLDIIKYLGHAFFRDNVGRLSICKQWHASAWPYFAQDLRLTCDTLEENHLVRDHEAFMTRRQACITTVVLDLQHYPWSALTEQILSDTVSPLRVEDWMLEKERLNTALANLATGLRRCPRLRSLKLDACNPRMLQHHTGMPRDWDRGFLLLRPLAELCSMRQLTTLELDTAGSYPHPRLRDGDPEPPYVHICKCINALLPTLRRLVCCMDNICEVLLSQQRSTPAEDDTGNSSTGSNHGDNEPSRLEELIISLAIEEGARFDPAEPIPIRRSEHCQQSMATAMTAAVSTNSTAGAAVDVKATIINQATALVRRLRNPRLIRVIYLNVEGVIIAYDAMDKQSYEIDPDTHWEAKLPLSPLSPPFSSEESEAGRYDMYEDPYWDPFEDYEPWDDIGDWIPGDFIDGLGPVREDYYDLALGGAIRGARPAREQFDESDEVYDEEYDEEFDEEYYDEEYDAEEA